MAALSESITSTTASPFLSCEGWGHIFVGNRTETTRWVYEKQTDRLIAAQVMHERKWVGMEERPVADLLESIKENNAIEDPASFGLTLTATLPTWAKEVTLKSAGYAIRERDPKVKPAFAGAFMVTDPLDHDGYSIVGDERDVLINEAYEHLFQ